MVIAVGVGAAALATGAVLWAIGGRAAPVEAAVAPRSVTVAVRGRF